MVIAWLVVRKNFSGKEALDFSSNLGGAIPGTILGIGFIMAFNKPPIGLAIVIYALLALVFAQAVGKNVPERLIILTVGTITGVFLSKLDPKQMFFFLGGLYIAVGLILLVVRRKISLSILVSLVGLYIMSTNWAVQLSKPVGDFSRTLGRGFWSNAIFQVADYIKTLLQPAPSLLAIAIFVISFIVLMGLKGRMPRIILGTIGLAVPCALSFTGIPFGLVGGAYIIMAAYIVRSLPASVRAGVASLQQIDPSIEEASNSLGADAQYTFRKVTLPLILPALLAGLIFSFTRHMTSLSAIIFLVNAKWRIVTASILSEWEQGGVSIAAAYSTVIIILVLLAIFVLNLVTKRLFRGRDGIDLSQGM
jgi:iron(III) transport system permease protein